MPHKVEKCLWPAPRLSRTSLQALAEATGKSPAQIKKMYEQEGDLGVVAATARSKQNTLFKPKELTLQAVFKCVHCPPACDCCYLQNFQFEALFAFSIIDGYLMGSCQNGSVLRGCCLGPLRNMRTHPAGSLQVCALPSCW